MNLFKRICFLMLAISLSFNIFANDIKIQLKIDDDASFILEQFKQYIPTLKITKDEITYLNKRREDKINIDNLVSRNSSFTDGLLNKREESKPLSLEEGESYKIDYSLVDKEMDELSFIDDLDLDYIFEIKSTDVYTNVKRYDYNIYTDGKSDYLGYYSQDLQVNKDNQIIDILLKFLTYFKQNKSIIKVNANTDNLKINQKNLRFIISDKDEEELTLSSISKDDIKTKVKTQKDKIIDLDIKFKEKEGQPVLIKSRKGSISVTTELGSLNTPFFLDNYLLPTTIYAKKDGFLSKSVALTNEMNMVNIDLIADYYDLNSLVIESQDETYTNLLIAFGLFSSSLIIDTFSSAYPKTSGILDPLSTILKLSTALTVVISVSNIFEYYSNLSLALD